MSDTTVSGVEAVQAALARWAQDVFRQRLRGAAAEIAQMLQQYAIDHHPWQVDTGRTNETTRAQIVELTEEMVTISLSAGMSYDVFLETARDGKWSWLWPTLMANREAILETLARHLRGGASAQAGGAAAGTE